MCERIHTATPFADRAVEVELVQYPAVYDGPAGHALARVLSDIASRRVHQIGRGYDHAHDDAHDADDMEAHIRSYLQLAARASTDADYRDRLIDVAALAVAAVERWDRPAPPPQGIDWPSITRGRLAPESAAGERAVRQEQQEVTRWLCQAIGERMGRTGDAALSAVTGRMRVVLLTPAASDLEAVEAAIKARWGVSLRILSAATVADIAARITVATQGGSAT